MACLRTFRSVRWSWAALKDEKVDVDFVVWLIRGGGRNILFDSGFHRERWFKQWKVTDYLRPDEAVRQAGVKPEEVTDVVISHAHWDHMGGIDLFPKATVWIQKDEFRYYTGDAWQPGGHNGGIDPDDIQELVRLNTEGRLRLVDGDNVEIHSRNSRVRRLSAHLCLAVPASRGQAALRAGIRQCLFLPQSCRAQGERHIQRCRPPGEYQRAAAHDRAGGFSGSRGARTRCAAVSEVPDRRTRGQDQVAGESRSLPVKSRLPSGNFFQRRMS